MKTPTLFLLLISTLLLFGCHVTGEKEGDDGGGFEINLPVYPQAYAEPSVSPDGSKLLFVRNKITRIDRLGGFTIDPDSSGIWMAESDGSNMKLLIQSQNVGTPSFSPDMKWILFEGAAQIYKVPFTEDSVNMESLVQLTSEGRNFFPDWSPDGNWIAYDNTNCGSSNEPPPPNSCGVLKIKTNGTRKDFLFSGRMPDWSNNEEKIVYVGLHGELYVFSEQNWMTSRLTYLNEDNIYATDNRYPRYSPDDTQIVFQSDEEIWTMDATGSNLLRLTTEGGLEPAWTPDHKIIYVDYSYSRFSKDNGTLWIMDADGSGKQQLTFNFGLQLQ